MTTATPNQPLHDVQVAKSSRKLSAMFALALGLVIVFAAGFAPSHAVHNAAHDTRHTLAFPCH